MSPPARQCLICGVPWIGWILDLGTDHDPTCSFFSLDIAKISSRTLKGACHYCHIRYVWPTKTGRLRDARCPRCNHRLTQTVYYAQGPWELLHHAHLTLEGVPA